MVGEHLCRDECGAIRLLSPGNAGTLAAWRATNGPSSNGSKGQMRTHETGVGTCESGIPTSGLTATRTSGLTLSAGATALIAFGS
jgi:hypothetical protein